MAGKRAGVMLPLRSAQVRSRNPITVCHIYEPRSWLQKVKEGLTAVCGLLFTASGAGDSLSSSDTFKVPSRPRSYSFTPNRRPPSSPKVDTSTQTPPSESLWTPKALKRPHPPTPSSEPYESKRPRLTLAPDFPKPELMWTPQKPTLASKVAMRKAPTDSMRKVLCSYRLLGQFVPGDGEKRLVGMLLDREKGKSGQSAEKASEKEGNPSLDSTEVVEKSEVSTQPEPTTDPSLPQTMKEDVGYAGEGVGQGQGGVGLVQSGNPFLCPVVSKGVPGGFVFGANDSIQVYGNCGRVEDMQTRGCDGSAMDYEAPLTVEVSAEGQHVAITPPPRPFGTSPGLFTLGKLPARSSKRSS